MEQEQKKERNNERLIMIVMLILIALIIIIFLFIHCLGLINHKPRIPTGNIDIFDITFGNCNWCANNCGCNNKDIKCNCNSPECICNGKNLATTDEENAKAEDGKLQGIQVYDRDTAYSTHTDLNIFKQTSYYVVDDRIAPTSENTYQFVIRNNNDFHIKYDLEVTEKNIYNINMRYRLKQNGKYVVGNDNEYVTADELDRYNIGLSNNSYDVYTLDWKWVEGENDTKVGNEVESYYGLDLKITATQL